MGIDKMAFRFFMLVLAALPIVAIAQVDSTKKNLVIIEEKMPVYPGGDGALMSFIGSNTIYPQQALELGITGVPYISYWVEKDGSVGRVHVAKGAHPFLDNEAVRVVQSLTGYEPGYQNNKAVAVQFTVPLRFNLAKEKGSPQWHFDLAIEERKKGKKKKARKNLDKAIDLGSGWYIQAISMRAEWLFEDDEIEEAMADYSKGLKIDKKRTDLWIGKAKCQFEMGKLNDALKSLETAAKCNPYATKALSKAAEYCMDKNQFARAEPYLNKAIETRSHNGWLYLQRGNSLAGQDKMEQACKDWRQAVLLREKDAQLKLDEHCSAVD